MSIRIIPEATRITDNDGHYASINENDLGQQIFNVHDADYHHEEILKYFRQNTSTIQYLSVATSTGAIHVTVGSGTAFSAGSSVVLTDGTTEEATIMKVTSISGNSVFFDRPIENSYAVSTAYLNSYIYDMNVAGTMAAPQVYELAPTSGTIWHITCIHAHILDGTDGDDSTFGGITALTNGVTFRVENTKNRNIGNWKSNQDMILDYYNFDYSAKAPAGLFGYAWNWDFQADAGWIVYLDGSNGDKMKILVQDDLTGLNSYQIKAIGHTEESN